MRQDREVVGQWKTIASPEATVSVPLSFEVK